MTKFGNLIKDFRDKNNLTRAALAKLISGKKDKNLETRLYQFEIGNHFPCNEELIDILVEVLGISANDLNDIIAAGKALQIKAKPLYAARKDLALCPKCGQQTRYKDVCLSEYPRCDYGFEQRTHVTMVSSISGFDSEKIAKHASRNSERMQHKTWGITK